MILLIQYLRYFSETPGLMQLSDLLDAEHPKNHSTAWTFVRSVQVLNPWFCVRRTHAESRVFEKSWACCPVLVLPCS